MAGCRLELLFVLTWTLLLVSVRGWERINETQFRSLYETEERGGPLEPTDDRSGLDHGEAKILEDAVLEAEGVSTSENFDPDIDYDDLDVDDYGPPNFASGTDDGFQVKFEDELPRSWPGSCNPVASDLEVVCSETGFQITLPAGPLSEVKVFGSEDRLLPIVDAPETCGYDVDPLTNTLTVPFNGCNVERHTDGFSLQLLYIDTLGQKRVSTTSCKKFDPDMLPRSSGEPMMCIKLTREPLAQVPLESELVPPALGPVPPALNPALPQSLPALRQNCALPVGEQVRCGQYGISVSDCQALGCCVDLRAFVCYYPLDECTVDQHFVFAIRYNSASIPVDPTKLVIPGNPQCKPVIVNNRVAIFKFRITECGTHSYDVGELKIYLAEVQRIVHALNLKYGVITRTDPLRFLIECRYNKWGTTQSMTSVGYMVKSSPSSMPSSVTSNSLYGVELRIAKDETYSSFYDHHHQPLGMLLGQPVYLELRLSSPKMDAIILVNYCLAYPRSARNALVLIYEGCANPHDPHVSILKVSNLHGENNERRFIVSAFQFMDQRTNKYLNEEASINALENAKALTRAEAVEQIEHGQMEESFHVSHRRSKRSWMDDNNPTYIDAIGVPRGVPDEYKLVDQIAAGFENIPLISALFPITPSKNVDRINYIHYNVQRLGNFTEAGFAAVHEQLAATSLVAFQNRIAVDMLLADKGGVCSMFAILTLCGCCCIPCLRALINRLITTAITPPAPEQLHPLLEAEDNPDSDIEMTSYMH